MTLFGIVVVFIKNNVTFFIPQRQSSNLGPDFLNDIVIRVLSAMGSFLVEGLEGY